MQALASSEFAFSYLLTSAYESRPDPVYIMCKDQEVPRRII